MKSRLEIPLGNVVSAGRAGAEAHSWLHGIRAGGAHVPGVISAGRFYSQGQLVFWDVHDADKAIGIDLRDERYARLVIQVADPEAEISRIMAAVAGVRRAERRRGRPGRPGTKGPGRAERRPSG